MMIRYLFVLCLGLIHGMGWGHAVLAQTGAAHALTAQECADIRATYGIVPPQCARPTSLAPTTLGQTMIGLPTTLPTTGAFPGTTAYGTASVVTPGLTHSALTGNTHMGSPHVTTLPLQQTALRQPILLQQPTAEHFENNIFFTRGGSTIDLDAQRQLRRLAEVLNAPVMQNTCFKLIGHSDSSGDSAINEKIASERALAVRNMLVPLMINPARIELLQSYGEEAPIAALPSDSKWQRRVEIWARPC